MPYGVVACQTQDNNQRGFYTWHANHSINHLLWQTCWSSTRAINLVCSRCRMLMCLLSPMAHRKTAHRAATMPSIFIFALLLCSCVSCSAQAYRDLTRTKALSIRDSDALAASDAALPAGSTLQLALVVFRCAQHGEGRMSCCMLLLLQPWQWCIWLRAALVRASPARQQGTLAYGVHVSTGALRQSCGEQMQLLEQRLGQTTPYSMASHMHPPVGNITAAMQQISQGQHAQATAAGATAAA